MDNKDDNHIDKIEDTTEKEELSQTVSSDDDRNSDQDIFQTNKTRHRPRKRPSFKVDSKNRLRVRVTKSSLHTNKSEGAEAEESDDSDEVFSRESAAGYSSRDLSPVEQVRMYVNDCATEMVEDFEKIYLKMSEVAEGAVARSTKLMSTGSEMVQRTGKGGVNIVHHGAEMVHHGAEIVKRTARDGAEGAVELAKSAAEVPAKILEKAVLQWKTSQFTKLPAWMKDNEHLHFGHRPELGSFKECFKSIFRIHTETGNIWTHLIGFVAFIAMTIIFYVKPLCDNCHEDVKLGEKLIFLFFFIGAILCLGMSSLFHTVCCHSPEISDLFSKLDYTGIALLTIGSFVPWIYYGFYCQFTAQVVYLTTITILGVLAVIVTLHPSFGTPSYRPLRALTFVCLGCFGFIPGMHCLYNSGWSGAVVEFSLDRLLTMAFLYIFGAFLYAARIPERFLPGKFDIWFQSHQIFHVFVVAAAFVHYNGIADMAVHRLTKGGACPSPESRSID